MHIHHMKDNFLLHCHFTSTIYFVGLLVHVYYKPFMCFIKMNVFICPLSTKTRGDQTWSCVVYREMKSLYALRGAVVVLRETGELWF